MSDLQARIAELEELDRKATAGPWVDDMTNHDVALIVTLRNNALEIIRELQAENERLRAIRRHLFTCPVNGCHRSTVYSVTCVDHGYVGGGGVTVLATTLEAEK